ncbi:DegV family protein [Streptococcus loxodontisalivarius]|uniref:DegV family protein with EDD domain n=1 Tax=Streptococcus loxodontisalivarius TaxID=1349415 RepID=A0ABS2PSY6_9STRE|nr:DegV family protein [Streptococcus loxodontisalivarius]MBM7643100.1 DegV family protein with EDD domain [Streptococcus loxodontisalivarius]
MTLAVITDSSVNLPEDLKNHEHLYSLDIPIFLDGETYVEGKNLEQAVFYEKMAASKELPKTSQPSLADFDELLSDFEEKGYDQVIGLFLSSGISGFWQNSQFLKDEHPNLTMAIPDTKITAAPMGAMVRNCLDWSQDGVEFHEILSRLTQQIDGTRAYILVDDLNHLVKGGRLSNGSALLGNLLSIKPILEFDQEGKIVVFEKVRTEKKALKRLAELAQEPVAQDTEFMILHTNAQAKAEQFQEQLATIGVTDVSVAPLCAVIATHLGEGAVVLAYTPKF